MDYYNQISNFPTILKQSTKVVVLNPISMVLLTIFSMFASSIFYLIFNFSAFSLMRDMLAKEAMIPISSSTSSEFSNEFLSRIMDSFPRVLFVYTTFILSYFIINFVSTLASIIVTIESYNNTTLSSKELLLRILRSWTGPLVTGFYTTLFVYGYVFLDIGLATPMLILSNWSTLGLAILFGMFSYVVYLNLSVPWIMGLVVTVVEGNQVCGIEALGRSAKIMKGQRVTGFLVNVAMNLVTLGVFLGSRMIRRDKFGMSANKISGLFLVNCSILIRILTFVMYTILYFRATKNTNDDGRVEMGWSHVEVEYGKLSNSSC